MTIQTAPVSSGREMLGYAAELALLPPDLHAAAIAMIEVSGMLDLVVDMRADTRLARAVREAISAGSPILCDCEMVRSGIQADLVPNSRVLSTLNDSRVPAFAKAIANTRSAAAVDLWGDQLDGAVVVVGNAPTALFRLFELLGNGAARPAAIIGIPVGFVGAAESKALLARGLEGIPFLTVLGRRGGSAMASAAFNAIARGTAS